MPTNDERREVAAMIREDEYALGHFGLVRILGLDRDAEPYFDGYHRYSDRLIRDMRMRLADLIEPEERTCRAVRFETHSFVSGNTVLLWRCSECENLIRPSASYCPDCGARLVES